MPLSVLYTASELQHRAGSVNEVWGNSLRLTGMSRIDIARRLGGAQLFSEPGANRRT